MLKTWHLILADAILTFLAVIIGLMLRLEIIYVGYFILAVWPFILAAVVLRPVVFCAFGLYRNIWRYAKTREFVILGIAVLAGTVLLSGVTLVWLFPRWMETFPRSLLIIEALVSLVFLGGFRVALKILERYPAETGRNKLKHSRMERALIVGAGSAGTLMVQELAANPQLGLKPVAFLDDDANKIGRKIQGLVVYGPRDMLPEVVEDQHIDQVVIAMPSAPVEAIRSILNLCEQIRVPSKTIPGLYEILSGRVSISRLRPVNISDLLRREPVSVNTDQVKRLLKGKRILVTGAGGSIGSELCHQILGSEPKQLVVLGHGENSLYSLLTYLNRADRISQNLAVQVADIRDMARMEVVFRRFQPQVVFHAAAHKHVPLMERNVEDAVTNNVLGTWNLLQSARSYGVERFVLISTDKAVNPVNVMGMTKRVAELLVHQAAIETGKPYVSVRFGNVLGSRGSVVPLFKRQIADGGPVTVTDPEMTRYFMTIPEAVQLVLQASALGKNGELFVLDMGEPVKIDDLARDMIELSGFEVGEDIQIEYTGLRPGERLYEKLFADQEAPLRTRHEKIFVSRNSAKVTESFEQQVEELIQMALTGQEANTRELLQQLACSIAAGMEENPG